MASLFRAAVIETLQLAPGLKKEVIVAAAATAVAPTRGAEVRCHYDGRLFPSGTPFDSSRTRGRPFVFRIGLGAVIRGWDEGIASMKVGERAILTCSPEFGYGAAGAGGVIPAHATLAFDVELLSVGDDSAGGSGCSVV